MSPKFEKNNCHKKFKRIERKNNKSEQKNNKIERKNKKIERKTTKVSSKLKINQPSNLKPNENLTKSRFLSKNLFFPKFE